MIYFVGIGAAIGSILRYLITVDIKKYSKTAWPTATLFINLLGAFLLGVLYGLNIAKAQYVIIGVGLIGGFTTFSTMNTEIIGLSESGKIKYAWLYAMISYTMGLVLVEMGFILGKLLVF